MAKYATGPLGYKKYCEERITYIDELRHERYERRKLLGNLSLILPITTLFLLSIPHFLIKFCIIIIILGLLKHEEFEKLNEHNKSIDKYCDLREALRDMKNHKSSLSAVKSKMRQQEQEEKQKLIKDDLRKKMQDHMKSVQLMELELKMQKEQKKLKLIEQFKEEEDALRRAREMNRKTKEEEQKKKDQEINKRVEERKKEQMMKDEESRKQMDEMLQARKRRPRKPDDPPSPKVKKPKIDPNKIKFNVTELIKNRKSESPSIVKSSAKKRVQSHVNKDITFNLSSRKSVPRNKYGYMSAIDGNVTHDERMNNTVDSQDPTADTNNKLPSLQRRLNDRLVEPLYLKATEQMKVRKLQNKLKIQERDQINEFNKIETKKRQKLNDRLAILNNISLGATSPKSNTIQEIWKNHGSAVKSTKIMGDHKNRVYLSQLGSPKLQVEHKDSLEKEIDMAQGKLTSQRQGKIKNNISMFSQLESNESFLNESLDSKKLLKKKRYKKRSRSKNKANRRHNNTTIPQTIQNDLNKKIALLNPTFDEAFKYHASDIADLSEDPTIRKKLENTCDIASPRFLMGLKKKQRMQEYWRSRVRKDFTKLNNDIEEVDGTEEIDDNFAIKKLIPVNSETAKKMRKR